MECPVCSESFPGRFTLGTHLVLVHGKTDEWIREHVPGLLDPPRPRMEGSVS